MKYDSPPPEDSVVTGEMFRELQSVNSWYLEAKFDKTSTSNDTFDGMT